MRLRVLFLCVSAQFLTMIGPMISRRVWLWVLWSYVACYWDDLLRGLFVGSWRLAVEGVLGELGIGGCVVDTKVKWRRLSDGSLFRAPNVIIGFGFITILGLFLDTLPRAINVIRHVGTARPSLMWWSSAMWIPSFLFLFLLFLSVKDSKIFFSCLSEHEKLQTLIQFVESWQNREGRKN